MKYLNKKNLIKFIFFALAISGFSQTFAFSLQVDTNITQSIGSKIESSKSNGIQIIDVSSLSRVIFRKSPIAVGDYASAVVAYSYRRYINSEIETCRIGFSFSKPERDKPMKNEVKVLSGSCSLYDYDFSRETGNYGAIVTFN